MIAQSHWDEKAIVRKCGWCSIIFKVYQSVTFAYINKILFLSRVIKDSEDLQEKQVPRETE